MHRHYAVKITLCPSDLDVPGFTVSRTGVCLVVHQEINVTTKYVYLQYIVLPHNVGGHFHTREFVQESTDDFGL